MLVELFKGMSFLEIFLICSFAGLAWYHLLCGALYYAFYKRKLAPQYKTQAKYPETKKVVKEATEGSISVLTATLNISVMIYCAQLGLNKLILNWKDASLTYHFFSILAIIAIVEVFEWWFHWLAHNNDTVWLIHKKHHVYSNPSPYSVLSDHPLDMWVKSSPLLWIPFIVPIYDAALVGWFAFVNMIYGTYLHAGFEFPGLPTRHSKWFVSSWHHNIHHAIHVPKNFGFFTGFMDILFGTRYTPADRPEKTPAPATQGKSAA